MAALDAELREFSHAQGGRSGKTSGKRPRTGVEHITQDFTGKPWGLPF